MVAAGRKCKSARSSPEKAQVGIWKTVHGEIICLKIFPLVSAHLSRGAIYVFSVHNQVEIYVAEEDVDKDDDSSASEDTGSVDGLPDGLHI